MTERTPLLAGLFAVLAALALVPTPTAADKDSKDHKVLIKNVSIFNGTSKKLITGKDVVVVGNTIAKIIPAGSGGDGYAEVIDGGGGYLTPGLIDNHWHCTLAVTYAEAFSSPSSYIDAIAIYEAKLLLMRGVTTVRDAAGNTAGLKRATCIPSAELGYKRALS